MRIRCSSVRSGQGPRCGVANVSPLDAGEWVGIIGLIGGGIGALAALFRSNNGKIHGRIDGVEVEMKEWDKLHADHATQLAVVKVCQENTRDRLEKIDETTRDSNQNLKDLSETVTKVLLAIQANNQKT